MSAEPLTRPFAQTPDVSRYVALPAVEAAVVEMCESIRCGDGLSILSGPWGSGKTQAGLEIVNRLTTTPTVDEEAASEAENENGEQIGRRLSDRVLEAVLLNGSGLITRRSFHQAVLHALDKPYAGLREQEARLATLDAARELAAADRPLVVVVDEAEHVSDRILEELRAITNFVLNGQPLVRITLIADPAFEERLATGSLEAVNQRIVCQANLRTLTTEESKLYIEGRLAAVGQKSADLFEVDAVEETVCIAGGLPRAIHVLAEKAIEVAGDRAQNAAVDLDAEAAHNDVPAERQHNEQESNASSHRVTRADVIDALAKVESLSMPWRRPLSLDSEEWQGQRRTDQLPQLEPLDGAVFEVGTSDRPATAAVNFADDLLSPLRRMHEFIDETGELGLGSSIGMPLKAVSEPIAIDLESELASDEALETLAESASQPDDEGVRDEFVDSTSVESPVDDASVVDNSNIEAVASDDLLATEDDQDSSAVVEADVPEFAHPFPAPIDSDDEEFVPTFECVEIDGTNSDNKDAEPDNDTDDEVAEDVAAHDETDEETQTEQPPVDSAAIADHRATSATKLLDAMLPLVENEQPDDADVEALETLLEADSNGVDELGQSGDEDSLGGQALNLAAELGAAIQLNRSAMSGPQDDRPNFAFEGNVARKPSVDATGTASKASALENTVHTDRAAVQLTSDEPQCVEIPNAAPRRLQGLFTRLRRGGDR